MPKKFTRTIEDFVCEHCGIKVSGNGYTNHCPECLYSKHVDVNPGDREAQCGGLMKPLRLEMKGQEYSIIHHCEKCDFERKNKVLPQDNYEALLALIQRL